MRKDAEPVIAVVLVSHARPGPIGEVIASIQAQRGVRVQVLVVDNPSPRTPEIERVVATFPCATLLKNEGNIGFGPSLNRGVAEATAPYLYLGTDDVVLDPDCLRLLFAAHAARSRPGLTAPVLYQADRRDVVRCAGGTLVMKLTPSLEIHRELPAGVTSDTAAYPVSFLPGGTLFLEASFFRSLGGYRHDFFMYEEDTELSLRVARVGRDLVVVPKAHAFDLVAPAEYDPARMEIEVLKNRLSTWLLHAPIGVAPFAIAKRLAYSVKGYLAGPSGSRVKIWHAWSGFFRAAPRLLKERWQFRALQRQLRGGG